MPYYACLYLLPTLYGLNWYLSSLKWRINLSFLVFLFEIYLQIVEEYMGDTSEYIIQLF